MDIITLTEVQSRTFIIQPGKQITLYATGLVGDDRVVVEMLYLSRAPDWSSDPCCNLAQASIEVLAAVPLKCADANEVVMTAEYPWVTLDAPQNVPLRVRVEGDPAAVVTVELHITESDGCLECTCRCYDTEWTPTGQERCEGTNVEKEEKSNCGNLRWVVDRAQTWVPTGDFRCEGTNVEKEEVNDCGTTRWVVDRDQTWTATGQQRCVDGNVERQEVNDCGTFRWVIVAPYTWTATGKERCAGTNVEREEVNDCCCTTRWVVDRAQTWTPTGKFRCEGTNVEKEEVNDCGVTRWVVSATQTWTPTGEFRCEGTNVEKKEVNDCGVSRWVTDRAQAWVATGVQRCYNSNVEFQEVNDCGVNRWVIDRAQTWTVTGETRCENNVIENREMNDCGDLRWTATSATCYCPSQRVSCSGEAGFGFHADDPKDPAATVEMAPCTGDTSVDSIWIYPSSGPGHTVKVVDCDGTLIGYAANTSTCAADCGCPETEVKVNVKNEVTSPTVNVDVTNQVEPAAVTVNNQIPAPATVASIAYQGDNLVITMTDGTTRTAPPNFCA